MCDRYGISDTAGAAIASATLQAAHLVDNNNRRLIIDRSKLRRARKCCREEGLIHQIGDDDIIGLYFDGRKDKTLFLTKICNANRQESRIEEHISLITEPGGKYIGHLSLNSGSAKNVMASIKDFVNENKLDKCIYAIGCDGTVCNTGRKGGIIRLYEEHLGRPLQWLICALHLNELPLRHIFQRLDGQTNGPKGFCGEIGKQLQFSTTLNIVKYNPIVPDLPLPTHLNNLSSDQQYLLDICNAVSTGECSARLAKRRPGTLCHSRWLTLANNLLRTYVGTSNPSTNLIIVATFIMRVYAPIWFTIKGNPNCINGARHFWLLIHLSRYLEDDLRSIVDTVLQRNAYFAHCENILLAMLTDSEATTRNIAVTKILKLRELENNLTSPRIFEVPKLNFSATKYEDMIFWDDTNVSEPPLTIKFSANELKDLAENYSDSIIYDSDQFKLPCHTQAVERCVKIVTEASLKVVGPIRRDGYIRNKIISQKNMPKFASKCDFKM